MPSLPWKSHSVTAALPSSLRAQRENLEVFAAVGESRRLAVGSKAPESWPKKLWWQSGHVLAHLAARPDHSVLSVLPRSR